MELFKSSNPGRWSEVLSSYETLIKSHPKPNIISLDHFYRNDLPNLLHRRNPNPYITADELSQLMQWKLTRGKWRPRLLAFVSSLSDDVVRAASGKAFDSLPDIAKAVSELTELKGVGPATASAVLAAYSPDVAPFMSDEAMEAAVGDAKDYSLKRYLQFVEKMQAKAETKQRSRWRMGSTAGARGPPRSSRRTMEAANSTVLHFPAWCLISPPVSSVPESWPSRRRSNNSALS